MRFITHFILVTILIGAIALLLMPTGVAQAQQLQGCTQTHVVATGENLYRIGLLYGVSWVTLAQWNNLTNPNVIYIGQVLCVSGSVASTPTTPTTGNNSGFGTGGAVVVRPGNPFGPTTDPRIYFPTITLGQQFELYGYNFPANTQVTIGMKVLGGAAYTPYYTATTDANGEFYVLVTIPDGLKTSGSIAVEARTAAGYYGLNWFYNF